MSFPFFDAIKGTTAGAAGTGAFTPNAASAGYVAWSTVPAGWIGLVRYEDGSAEELRFSYWNGTTLSRATAAFHSSSSGSALSLGASATAAMVASADMVAPHIGRTPWVASLAINGVTTRTDIGMPAVAATGTAAAAFIGDTATALGRQIRTKYTSATTANAQAGLSLGNGSFLVYYSTAAGVGGFEIAWRFGASAIPTGPRLFMGATDTSMVGSTGNPSAFNNFFAVFGKDSGDTNIQLMTNDGGVTAGKTDTGIPLVAGGLYQAAIWVPPGGGRVFGLLIRIDTGDIWYGSTTTDLPITQGYLLQFLSGLSATTGTAMVLELGNIVARTLP